MLSLVVLTCFFIMAGIVRADNTIGGNVTNDTENHEPFLTVVTIPETYLRSGPGNDYYATNVVTAGQTLEVYYVIDDQWCAVRPPKGSFTWVDARNIRINDKRIGEVLINGVNARVGSDLGNMCGAIQVVLDRGEKVFVFERIETPNDIDTPVWYKIAPPAGEFRFARISELQFDTNQNEPEMEQPRVLRMPSPILLVSGQQPQDGQQSQTSNQSPYLSSSVVPPGSLPIPDVSNTNNVSATNSDIRVASSNRPSTNPTRIQALPVVTENVHENTAEIDSSDFQEVLEQLKLDLADALIEQESAGENMQSLAHQARMLYQAAPTQTERAEVYRLIAGVERATRVRRYESRQNQPAETNTSSTTRDEQYDGRTMQLTRADQSSTRGANNEMRPLDNSQRFALPYMGEMDDSADTAPMTRYSAQESFFDNEGQYNNDYTEQRDIEIYLDQHGRYVDASGRLLDERMLNAILQNADTVLMYDPQTGGYHEMPQQHFGQSSQHNTSHQKSWLQRFISGEMFRGNEKTANVSQNMAANVSGYHSSDYATYTHQLTFGGGMVPGNGSSGSGYATNYDLAQYDTTVSSTGRKGFFATSQPSLISQLPKQHNPMQPRNYRGNIAAMTPQMSGRNRMAGSLPQEIVLPDNVEVRGDLVVFDESQGINLLGQIQNTSQQDQLELLIREMAASNTTANVPVMSNGFDVANIPATAPVVVQPHHGTTRPNLPLTEAESKILTRQLQPSQQIQPRPSSVTGQPTTFRPVQLMSKQQENQTGNHQVTGLIENGVGHVSPDAFDAIGKLGRVKNAANDMPKYTLVDEANKPICLVSSVSGIELESHVGKTLGLIGVQGNYVKEGKTFPHISAKAVYPIIK